MIDDFEAAYRSSDPADPDEPERSPNRADEPSDWRTEFRSYLDDPE